MKRANEGHIRWLSLRVQNSDSGEADEYGKEEDEDEDEEEEDDDDDDADEDEAPNNTEDVAPLAP